MRTQARNSEDGEMGSLAPLGIGLATLSLALVLAVLASASLYLTERRLTSVAEATAISVLIDAKGDLAQPLAVFASKWLQLQSLPGLDQVQLMEVVSVDQRTVRVRLCSASMPIFENYMFSEMGRVCSEALARRGR